MSLAQVPADYSLLYALLNLDYALSSSNVEKDVRERKKTWHKSAGNTLLIRNRITVSEKEVQELTRMGSSIPVARREEMWIKS